MSLTPAVLKYTLAIMKNRWQSRTYAFFKEDVEVHTENGKRYQLFSCANPRCKSKVRRNLTDTGLGNLSKHARPCWGEDVFKSVSQLQDIETARAALTKPHVDKTLLAKFAQKKGKHTYSLTPHTDTQTR
jgi:hypothetical protein